MSNNFIWPADRIFSGATIPGESGPRIYGKERVLLLLEALALQEPHHQIA